MATNCKCSRWSLDWDFLLLILFLIFLFFSEISLEIFLAHARILLKLRDIYKRYNNSSIQNLNIAPSSNNNINSGLNSNSATFISNNNNIYNSHYQQNLLHTSQNHIGLMTSRDSTSQFNLANNVSSNQNTLQDPKTIIINKSIFNNFTVNSNLNNTNI